MVGMIVTSIGVLSCGLCRQWPQPVALSGTTAWLNFCSCAVPAAKNVSRCNLNSGALAEIIDPGHLPDAGSARHVGMNQTVRCWAIECDQAQRLGAND